MPYKDRAQQIAYQLAWRNERRDKWFAENGPCAHCGSWLHLQLDHRDPSQKIHHQVWGWSEARRSTELAKCQVLCETCHKAKSRGEQPLGENRPNAILTDDIVRAIRSSTAAAKVLAQQYKVHVNIIYAVRRRASWRHVE